MSSDPQHLLRDVPDELALRVLALLLDAGSPLSPAAQAQATATRLTALDPIPLEIVDDPPDAAPPPASSSQTAPAGGAVPDAELARAALHRLLATDSDAGQRLPHAIELANEDSGERFEPATFALGGLILAVLQTEVDWTRSETGRWRLRVHKRAMRDSTIATLIRGLLHLPSDPEH